MYYDEETDYDEEDIWTLCCLHWISFSLSLSVLFRCSITSSYVSYALGRGGRSVSFITSYRNIMTFHDSADHASVSNPTAGVGGRLSRLCFSFMSRHHNESSDANVLHSCYPNPNPKATTLTAAQTDKERKDRTAHHFKICIPMSIAHPFCILSLYAPNVIESQIYTESCPQAATEGENLTAVNVLGTSNNARGTETKTTAA